MKSSKELEQEVQLKAERLVGTAEKINKELSPGQLLDQYYTGSRDSGLKGYMSLIKKDPVPGALIGAAVAWSASKNQNLYLSFDAQENLMPDLKNSKIKSKAHAVASKVSKAVDKGSNKVRSKTKQAASAISNGANSLKDTSASMATKTHTTMQEHPMLNVAVGFTIGSALGGMLPIASKEKIIMEPVAKKAKKFKDKKVSEIKSAVDQELDKSH